MRRAAFAGLAVSGLLLGCQSPQPGDEVTSTPEAAVASIDPVALAALVDSTLRKGMAEEHIPGAVVVVVQNGRVLLSKGYGVANIESGRPVSPDSTIWRIGSITKVFTALALVQLADRGRVDLDEDVNTVLRQVRTPGTYPQVVTSRHLLTHTGGIDEIPRVRLAPSRASLQPLQEFLASRLIRVRPPGLVTSYSSFGMALAGLIVEDVSGMSYERYLREHVWLPLGMTRTQITPSDSDLEQLATGYDYIEGVVQKAPYEWYHTIPASAINAAGMDMGRFMLALLDAGELDGRHILSAAATRSMMQRQATMHPMVPGWGLGFQENDLNGERIFEHGGDIAGFNSLLVLLPDRKTGFFVASHREGSNLRFTLERRFLDAFFPDRRQLTPPAAPTGGIERAQQFAGTYRWNLYCRSCGATAPQMPEFIVAPNADGSITLQRKRWVEVSPLFFRSTDGRERLGFAEDSTGKVMHLTGGSWNVLERVR